MTAAFFQRMYANLFNPWWLILGDHSKLTHHLFIVTHNKDLIHWYCNTFANTIASHNLILMKWALTFLHINSAKRRQLSTKSSKCTHDSASMQKLRPKISLTVMSSISSDPRTLSQVNGASLSSGKKRSTNANA